MSATDLFWDATLQQEKIRVLCESNSRDVPVSDILLDHSSDEDVPIVATLELEKKKKQKKQKVVKEKRWEYVTVAEPTGIASKYWDADAPLERATKRVAKQRITEIHVGELEPTDLPEATEQLVVPDAQEMARIAKSKRTPQQRRSDLLAFMAKQRSSDIEGETGQEREDRINREEWGKTASKLTVGMVKALGNLSPGLTCDKRMHVRITLYLTVCRTHPPLTRLFQ